MKVFKFKDGKLISESETKLTEDDFIQDRISFHKKELIESFTEIEDDYRVDTYCNTVSQPTVNTSCFTIHGSLMNFSQKEIENSQWSYTLIKPGF